MKIYYKKITKLKKKEQVQEVMRIRGQEYVFSRISNNFVQNNKKSMKKFEKIENLKTIFKDYLCELVKKDFSNFFLIINIKFLMKKYNFKSEKCNFKAENSSNNVLACICNSLA